MGNNHKAFRTFLSWTLICSPAFVSRSRFNKNDLIYFTLESKFNLIIAERSELTRKSHDCRLSLEIKT